MSSINPAEISTALQTPQSSSAGVTLKDIVASDWSVKLDTAPTSGDGIGQVVEALADISQCLGIIVTTPQGTDPLRPTFAMDLFSFIDLPDTIGPARLVAAIYDAVTRWEPRIILESVSSQRVSNSQGGAHFKITMKWRLKINGTPGQTTVTIPFKG